MGSLILKNITSYSFNLTITGIYSLLSDIYIVQKDLYNGKKYYVGQNLNWFIFWSSIGNQWRLSITLGSNAVVSSENDAQYPWQAIWPSSGGDSYSFSLLNINKNKISIKKQNLGGGKINLIYYLKQYAPIINSITLNSNGDQRYPNVSFSQVPIEIRQYIIGYQVDVFFTQAYIGGEFQEFGILNPSDSPILLTSFPTNQTTSPIIGGNLESLGATDPTFNFKIRMRGISSNSYTAWSNIVTYGTYIPH